jgi:hypothetical protein
MRDWGKWYSPKPYSDALEQAEAEKSGNLQDCTVGHLEMQRY